MTVYTTYMYTVYILKGNNLAPRGFSPKHFALGPLQKASFLPSA